MYLDHRTVDDKCNIIVDTYIIKGNVHDSGPFIERAEYIKNKYRFNIKKYAVDSGYLTLDIKKYLIYLEYQDIEDMEHQNQEKKKASINILKS